ncbi:hypothetical protein HPB48_014778 [Haemaphysalis longicornis]|uniref:Glycoside hydrolase 35 catalytic domain-containing protein n=1 Tax=Haemaphysalis longicornis TaxID=44386 RepID=A0A9J6GFR4_HAELO|nr:hypothetical protein HPB48_014778 [Haemaphysalis longicornis]
MLFQVENEYSSYNACDSSYMRRLRNLAREQLGDDVLLFTTDGFSIKSKCGRVPGALATIDFGTDTDPKKAWFGEKGRKAPRGPLINSELYTGWLDHWDEQHQTVHATVLANSIRKILNMGASFNL